MDYYGTEAEFIAYHTARGRDVSEYSSVAIAAALLVASEWLDGSFRNRWPGYRYQDRTLQTRDWPRSWVADRDGYPVTHTSVPVEIDQATYEAAYRHLVDATALLVDYTPDKYKSVRIEGSVAVEYRALNASTIQKQFPAIGLILDRLLGGSDVSALSSRTVRA